MKICKKYTIINQEEFLSRYFRNQILNLLTGYFLQTLTYYKAFRSVGALKNYL